MIELNEDIRQIVKDNYNMSVSTYEELYELLATQGVITTNTIGRPREDDMEYTVEFTADFNLTEGE